MTTSITLIDGPYEGHVLRANESYQTVPEQIYVSLSERVEPGTPIYTVDHPQTGDSVYARIPPASQEVIDPERAAYKYVGQFSVAPAFR